MTNAMNDAISGRQIRKNFSTQSIDDVRFEVGSLWMYTGLSNEKCGWALASNGVDAKFELIPIKSWMPLMVIATDRALGLISVLQDEKILVLNYGVFKGFLSPWVGDVFNES